MKLSRCKLFKFIARPTSHIEDEVPDNELADYWEMDVSINGKNENINETNLIEPPSAHSESSSDESVQRFNTEVVFSEMVSMLENNGFRILKNNNGLVRQILIILMLKN